MPLRIKNWDAFQHYKWRRPPWIKVYTDLLNDPEWHKLSGDDAKALAMLWLIAAEQQTGHRGQLPPITKLAFRMRTTEEALNTLIPRLNHWIVDSNASTVLAPGLHVAIPEYRVQSTEFGSGSESGSLPSFLSLLSSSESESGNKKKLSSSGSGARAVPRSAATWEAYRAAYQARYKVDPVRNKLVNTLLCQVVEKLGAEEAPLVAAFYVMHNKPLYVSNRHPANLLVRDAEGLRTQWASGITATSREAESAEQRDNLKEQHRRVMARRDNHEH